jgi:hypothetical protein
VKFTIISLRIGVCWVPINEILRTVRLAALLRVSVDVCEYRSRYAMPLIGDSLAKRFKLVVRRPLGQFRAINLCQELPNGLAER